MHEIICKAYKEPKSIVGMLIMSSVSTPYEPSNVGPPGELCFLELAGEYDFGQPSQ
jgi:hypothetical protein